MRDIVIKARKLGMSDRYVVSWITANYGAKKVIESFDSSDLDDSLVFECAKDFIEKVKK